MKYNKLYYILILTLFFFVIGLILCINAILIPYFKIALELTYFQSYLIAFPFHISNLVMAIALGLLLNKLEYRSDIRVEIIIMSFGILIFVPEAFINSYLIFFLGFFCLGVRLGLSFGSFICKIINFNRSYTANSSPFIPACIGFTNSLIYVRIWPLSIHRIEKHT